MHNLKHYRVPIFAFMVFQLVGAFVPGSVAATQWYIVAGYLIAAVFAAGARAPWGCAAAVSVAIVRTMVLLKITGAEFRVAGMIFADLFFVLVIFEAEGRRISRAVARTHNRGG